MNLLLDTHIALWAITDDAKLSLVARELIVSPDNVVWVSAASVWEIAIKRAQGRGNMPISSQQALEFFKQSGYRILPIDAKHATVVENLPAHHQDPYDRILVAQALSEPMRLITHDPKISLYSDTVILV